LPDVHPRPNENAWLLGYAYREKLELVEARGLEPAGPTLRVVIADWLANALRAAA
jgi:hypothetical protein